MKRLIYCCLLLLCVGKLTAQQQTALVVYTAKGKAEVKENGQNKALKKGTALTKTASVTLFDGDDIVFICSNYNTIKLKKAGTYKVADLLAKCTPPTTSVTTAYLQYVWEEFTHKHDNVADHHKKYMKSTGAVSRGCQGVDINPAVDTLNYFSGPWQLKWITADGINVKGFELYDAEYDGRKIATLNTNAYKINIAALLKNVKETGDYYMATVVYEKVSCQRQYIRIYDKADYATVLKRLKKQVIKADKATEYFMLGFLMEQENFYADALQYYKKATAAAPKNKTFKSRYDLFKSQFHQ